MSFYEILRDAHSGWRYLVFLLVAIAIVAAIIGLAGNRGYSEGNRKLNLFAMISVDIQLLIGIVLYFVSPFVQFNSETMKVDVTRYFTVEHWVGMLFAITLIHIGHGRSKKGATAAAKHKSIAIFYFLALFVIIGTIIAGKLPVFGGN